jgi:cyclopropane fatty-acyl-phospholipid synthase-like methyltransferase
VDKAKYMIAGAEAAGLIVDAVHVHPPSDYGKTLRAWRLRFEAAWSDLESMKPALYDESIRRKWLFYLASMEATFSEDTLNFRIAQLELRSPSA